MNFLLSLAHFCEVHGPTSIICTQLLSPNCDACQHGGNLCSPDGEDEGEEEGSSDGSAIPDVLPEPTLLKPEAADSPAPSQKRQQTPPPPPRAQSNPHMTPPLSPYATPPSSPPLSLPAALSQPPAAPTCRNCALTLPKSIAEKLPPTSPPVLRSRETLWHSPTQSSPAHTHPLTYISTASPPPPLAAPLRRAALRALSCELPPTSPTCAQPATIFFGDADSGYTLAYVFRIADPRARGGRRVYALLATGKREMVVGGWRFVGRAFQGLVRRIGGLAGQGGAVGKGRAAAAAGGLDESQTASTTSLGTANSNTPTPSNPSIHPVDSFLKRPAASQPTELRGLADLTGREDIFVEVHAGFVGVLSGVGKRFGWAGVWNETETEGEAEEDGGRDEARGRRGRASVSLGGR